MVQGYDNLATLEGQEGTGWLLCGEYLTDRIVFRSGGTASRVRENHEMDV